MSNTNNVNVPEAKSAMNRFKMECASEVGVQLSAQAGSVGGQMVKKMIEAQEKQMSGK